MWNSVIGEHPILVPYDWFEYTTFSYKKTNFLPTTGRIKIFYVRIIRYTCMYLIIVKCIKSDNDIIYMTCIEIKASMVPRK